MKVAKAFLYYFLIDCWKSLEKKRFLEYYSQLCLYSDFKMIEIWMECRTFVVRNHGRRLGHFFFTQPTISAVLQAFNFLGPRFPTMHGFFKFDFLFFCAFFPPDCLQLEMDGSLKNTQTADGFHHFSAHTQGQSNKSPNTLPEPISSQAGRLTAFIKILRGKGVFFPSFFLNLIFSW